MKSAKESPKDAPAGRPVNPKDFGLHPSNRIEKTGKDAFALVIRRKSRIIMKDGATILGKAEKIWTKYSTAEVSVHTTAPVCSKTRAFLLENHIVVKPLPEDGP